MKNMALSPGQILTALREFEMGEPSYSDVIRFGLTPVGVDRVCAIAAPTVTDLSVLGSPVDRRVLAGRLLEILPVEDRIPDPLPAAKLSTLPSSPP
jgi:hypothetical protein